MRKVAVMVAMVGWMLSTQVRAGVLSFQEGVNGYTGNDATYIYATNSGTVHDGLTFMNTGGSGNASLLRFNDIFGAGTNQVDAGATINSATLTLTTLSGFVNLSNEVNDVYNILTPWVAATTSWISFAGGTSLAALQSQLSDANNPIASFTPNADGAGFTIDITTLVQGWSDGDFANYGLAINNLNPGGDGASFHTDNSGNINLRPLLAIDYNEVAVPEPGSAILLFVSVIGMLIRRRLMLS